jgi:phosphoenolpyruvate synthase/pyruvate phosphate dikinase
VEWFSKRFIRVCHRDCTEMHGADQGFSRPARAPYAVECFFQTRKQEHVEMGLALNRLAQFFDEEEVEPAPDHPKVREFLAKFGCRSTVELDLGVKRWSEDPTYVMNLVETYMADRMYARNIAEVHETAARVERLIDDVYQAVKRDKGERRARKLRRQIVDARRAGGMREYPKFAIVRILALAREVMLGVGREYRALDLIDEAEDIFFLYPEEIRAKQGLKQRVAANRAAYRREMARTSIPRVLLNTGETYYSAQAIDPNSKVLQGMPLSPGAYAGTVRVVFDPNTSDLREGEVLVTESTNPAWTPLFMAAKGLIMEYGGPVSHGGIVAREYGIPAVVGIPSATNVLQDGQLVRVDGESGIVEILE